MVVMRLTSPFNSTQSYNTLKKKTIVRARAFRVPPHVLPYFNTRAIRATQVEASRTDTPARSAACTAFVAMLPLPFQIPVREAFADWRNRFLVNASGNAIMFGTMMEYAAALFSHEFAPVLKPAPFRQWITISKNEVIRDASKNHGTIADYIGNDFNLGLGDGSSVWAGSRGVLRAIGVESDGFLALEVLASLRLPRLLPRAIFPLVSRARRCEVWSS